MPYKKLNQQGIALSLIIVIIVVLVAAGGVFWFITSKDKSANKVTQLNPNISASEAKTRIDLCKKAGGDDDLCTFLTSYDGLKGPYTAVSTAGSESMTISYDDKGNSKTESPTGSIVVYNGTTYVQNGDVWIKYPSAGDNENDNDVPIISNLENEIEFDENMPENHVRDSYKKIGTEACGNLECLKYEIAGDASDGITKTYIWFDTKEYKLRKIEFTDSENRTHGMTFSYEPVTITEPSPVQEFNASFGL